MKNLLIVTPTLGTSATLDHTVQSCRLYGAGGTHVICCPEAMVSELSVRYPHCVVLAEPQQCGGVYEAINFALSKFLEGFVAWTYINDDDCLMPGFAEVAKLITPARQNQVMYCRVMLCDSSWGGLTEIQVARRRWQVGHFFHCNRVPFTQQGAVVSAQLFNLLNGFDRRYKLAADTDFFRRAFEMGAQFTCVNVVGAKYMLRQGQLSANRGKQDEERVRIGALNRFYTTTIVSRVVVWLSTLENCKILIRRWLDNRTFRVKEIVRRAQGE